MLPLVAITGVVAAMAADHGRATRSQAPKLRRVLGMMTRPEPELLDRLPYPGPSLWDAIGIPAVELLPRKYNYVSIISEPLENLPPARIRALHEAFLGIRPPVRIVLYSASHHGDSSIEWTLEVRRGSARAWMAYIDTQGHEEFEEKALEALRYDSGELIDALSFVQDRLADGGGAIENAEETEDVWEGRAVYLYRAKSFESPSFSGLIEAFYAWTLPQIRVGADAFRAFWRDLGRDYEEHRRAQRG